MQSQRFVIFLLLAITPLAFAGSRHWKSGTLTATDQQKVAEGSTYTTNSDATYKNKGNRVDSSQNTTTTSSDNMETYQTYTIDGGNKIIIAKEHLLFPWSKPANVNVGEPVKYVMDRGKIIILDDDGKEHKASVVSASMKTAE